MFTVQALSHPILASLSFSLEAGQCLMVRGPSGVGKSVLLRALADLDHCDGTVALDGRDRMSMEAPAWRRQVGLVPAEPGWWDDRLDVHFRDWPAVQRQLPGLRLGDLDGARRLPTLSTGERQRLALLRALEVMPAVLLLDEPTSALDPAARLAVEQRVRRFLDEGGHVLWVSHDDEQVARVGDHILELPAGRCHPVAA